MKNFSLPSNSLALFCALILVACGDKKTKEEPKPLDVKTETLVARSWRVSADVTVTTQNGTTTTVDNYAVYPACAKDDFIQFKDDKTMIVDEGPTKCAASDPQRQTGVWSWNSDQTIMTMTDPTFSGRGTYSGPIDLNAAAFKLTLVDAIAGGTKTQTITYTGF
ncbi:MULTISPECIES: hypothetical protein [Hymenobacter]|uniref:Lipocalin-like domain-containing protein n=1 Tax=Hymenobacter jejuensis TaxID=2502781 RepID=A0A5B8A4V9_9BACT|nr:MULTISPECIES: hypothetical protein [Hymenobacter]MBC6991985.1 hypothetical protein [Hymenobacter sp. BT491]QDA62350.1 hypothetical protein FHG12_20630 [Hymenobacter jejuensis]